MPVTLIADSGSTKTEWCLINGNSRKTFLTQGLSPYFLSAEQIGYIIENELVPKLKKAEPSEVFFLWYRLQQCRECNRGKKSHSKKFS